MEKDSNTELGKILDTLRKNGFKSNFEFEHTSSLENCWKVISDWSNISWVLGMKDVKIIEPLYGKPNRELIKKDDGIVGEILLEADEKTHKIAYYVYASSWPLKHYMGELSLSQPEKGTGCIWRYQATYIPKDGVDVEKFKGPFEQGFKTYNIPFLKGTNF